MQRLFKDGADPMDIIQAMVKGTAFQVKSRQTAWQVWQTRCYDTQASCTLHCC